MKVVYCGLVCASLVALSACDESKTLGGDSGVVDPVIDAGQEDPDGSFTPVSLEEDLRDLLVEHQISRLDIGPAQEPIQVALGQLLFFDKELSGNRDVACATCHHPTAGSGDDLSVSIGVGGAGLGATRTLGDGKDFIPRNAPDIYNRGAPEWVTMFWDGRVATQTYGGTPAGGDLPAVLVDKPLAAQAMFPPTSRAEMRGEDGDNDVFGAANELGPVIDTDLVEVWARLADRLRVIPEYVTLFKLAFDDVNDAADIGFEHAALAIAAFEVHAFSFTDCAFDRYVAGDPTAISVAAKRGAVLFYGEAKCVKCHSGNLFTDQLYHNIAAPQVGPGRGLVAPADLGRAAVTGDSSDDYAFRTPPLRATTQTGPWMHDGAYTTLRAAVEHHIDPASSLMNYDKTQLSAEMQLLVMDDSTTLNAMIAAIDPDAGGISLQAGQVDDIMAFLETLTDESALDLSGLVPSSVPSGLPVDGAAP